MRYTIPTGAIEVGANQKRMEREEFKSQKEEVKDKENDYDKLLQELLIVCNALSQEAAQEKKTPDINAMLELEDLVVKPIRDPSKKVLAGLEGFEYYSKGGETSFDSSRSSEFEDGKPWALELKKTEKLHEEEWSRRKKIKKTKGVSQYLKNYGQYNIESVANDSPDYMDHTDETDGLEREHRAELKEYEPFINYRENFEKDLTEGVYEAEFCYKSGIRVEKEPTKGIFDVNNVTGIHEARYYCKDTLEVKRNKYKGVKVEMELSMAYPKLAKVDCTNIKRDKYGKSTRYQEAPKRKTANRINGGEKNGVELKVDERQGKSCDANCAEDDCGNETAMDNDDEKREESEDDKMYDSDEMKVDEENNEEKGQHEKKLAEIKDTPNIGECYRNGTRRFADTNDTTKMLEVVESEVGDISECVEAIDTKLVKHLFDPGGRVEPNIQFKP
ncbi:36745_t:CDS:2, partial [Gigaspora margarita]